jgi:hypothetical protein
VSTPSVDKITNFLNNKSFAVLDKAPPRLKVVFNAQAHRQATSQKSYYSNAICLFALDGAAIGD